MKKWVKTRCCRRCGNPVVRESHRGIDYLWFCPECHENMCGFETYVARRIFNRRKRRWNTWFR